MRTFGMRRPLNALVALVAMALIGGFAGRADADLVLDWNTDWLESVKATGGGPGPIARSGAMVHVAIYDAVKSIDRGHTPYLYQSPVTPDASVDAAINAAAHRVLSHLYPGRQSLLDTTYTTRQGLIGDGAAKDNGIAIGLAAAEAIISNRAADGSDNLAAYVGGSGPGHWIPTEMGPGGDAWGQNWHLVTPFAIGQHDQFRPPAPPSLQSAEYTAAYNEVKTLGSATGSTRTAEQTQIAMFWANDVDGSWKPPGHLNYISQGVSKDQNLGVTENARLFALVNLALADASIVSWDAKFATEFDLWRPITGIRSGNEDDPSTPGNEDNLFTTADPDWVPLSANAHLNGFTPPFPAYTSGHATFSAAWAAIMADFFGTDSIPFTILSGDPAYDQMIAGNPDYMGFINGVPAPLMRQFDSFSEAALENGRSRVYLGVHWQFDADFGYSSGTEMAQFIFNTALTSAPEPTSLALFGSAAAILLLRRRRRC